MNEVLLELVVVAVIGAISATARYINDLGKENKTFSFLRWGGDALVGATIAMITGAICKHYHLDGNLIFAFVGISGLSAKEIIEYAPRIVLEKLKNERNIKP